MNNMKKFFALILLSAVSVFAQHSFPVVSYPTWVVEPNLEYTSGITDEITNEITLEFADINQNMSNCDIYFSRNPGGADFKNYPEKINNANRDGYLHDNGVYVRKISFDPMKNANFKPGINYVIVRDNAGQKNSNEVKIILRHTEQSVITAPKSGLVGNTTPKFSWTRHSNVPYSHVLLSDEAIDISGGGEISLESVKGISMIWQTITKDNSITYGEPDPSGIFSTVPPPLSPGKIYSWFVFNNYGNNPAYTAVGDVAFPAFFEITNPSAVGRETPQNVYPVTASGTLNNIDKITFKWKNLDPTASTYKVFVYTKAEMGGIGAQVVVWSGEVMAGEFSGKDEAELSMSAKDILSDNDYSWRVITMYNDGSGQAGDLSEFKYRAPSGTVTVKTREEILFVDNGNEYRFTQDLALAQVELEVFDGSLEETILFFTANNGFAERVRSVGTHRISIKKEGYQSESKIVQLQEGGTQNVEFYLRRPYSSIYGRITDSVGAPVNLANITAVSYNGDTVKTQSLPDGNYVLNCSNGDWIISVGRQGFVNSQPRPVQLSNGQNNRQDFTMQKNSLALSGTVINDDGNPVTGAVVKVFGEDGITETASLLSTPSDGKFSFSLPAGKYIISATKTGLVQKDTTITFSSSRNMQITLASGAAMLKGTLYGVSWIANSPWTAPPVRKTAAVINAKLEVIDTTGNASKIIATTTTDRVYGTYGVSIPAKPVAGFEYKLKFSADGFESVEGFTSAQDGIKVGNNYEKNFYINAFATISGEVIPNMSGVSVSLIRKSDKIQVAVTKTDNEGEFTFFRIPKGTYIISANGNGRTKDYVLQTLQAESMKSDETTVEGGKFRTEENGTGHDVSFIKIHTKEAKATILWTAKTSPTQIENDASVSVTVYSPLVQTLERTPQGNELKFASAGVRYLARATSSDADIIACVERPLEFEDDGTPEQIVKDTIFMPFKHIPQESEETKIAKLKLSRWSSVNVNNAQVYYRRKGETEYEGPISGTVSADTISFEVDIGDKAGNDIEYYFEIKTAYGVKNTPTVYSNEAYPYTRFVGADTSVISHWEVLAAGEVFTKENDNSLTLALDGNTEIYIKAYYGANFTPIETKKLKDYQFGFSTKESNVLRTSTDIDGASSIITGKSAGNAKLFVWLNKTKDKRDTIEINVTVTNSKINTISAVLRSPTEYPNFIKNTENAVFGVDAKDKDGESVLVTPNWVVTPKAAGKLDPKSGLFTPNRDFVGRVYIVAQVNSKVRHEFGMVEGEKGMLVAHPVMLMPIESKASNSSTKNKKTADLIFAANSAPSPIVVTFDNPELKNFILHNVEKINPAAKENMFIISDIFEISRRVGENFADDASAANVKLYVPEIYHKNLKNGQSDSEKLAIAVWDEKNLRWEYPRDRSPEEVNEIITGTFSGLIVDKAEYDDKEKSLSFSVSKLLNELGNIRIGIIGIGLETDAMVEVSPNPFSPFVSPMNDYFTIKEMDGNVKGTCIKITPKSSVTKFSPSAQVSIYSAEGTLVYRNTLNGLNPGETYYLFWDGRQQLLRTQANGMEVEPNTALFVRGGEMCRNGRYFVNVTIDDGKEKKRYTKEIILFK